MTLRHPAINRIAGRALFVIALTAYCTAAAQNATSGTDTESRPDERQDIGIEPGNPAGIETDREMARGDEAPLAEYTADNENWDSSIGVNWNRMQAKAREHWQAFSEMETVAIQGRRDALVDLVSDRYELSREQAERDVDTWAERVSREPLGD